MGAKAHFDASLRKLVQHEHDASEIRGIETISFGNLFTSQTRDPDENDDIDHGYFVFCQWQNTLSGDMFLCRDASSGEAIWKKFQFVEL